MHFDGFIVTYSLIYCNRFVLKLFFYEYLDKDVCADRYCCEHCEDESERDEL